MSNPNIVNTTSVKGDTVLANTISTTGVVLIDNTVSNSTYKIGTLIVSNIDTATPYDCSIKLERSSTQYSIINTVAIPPDTSIVVISRDTSIYLRENDKILLFPSSSNKLEALCSYEEIQ
jgi:hypothetical protein